MMKKFLGLVLGLIAVPSVLSASAHADTFGGRLVGCEVAAVDSAGAELVTYRQWAGGSLRADSDRLRARACSGALRACVKDLTKAMKDKTNEAGVIGCLISGS